MANLTVNTKNYGQITLNTKPHSGPLIRGRALIRAWALIRGNTVFAQKRALHCKQST